MVLNVHLLRYLWEVREELPGNRRQKKQILSRVESSVQDFVIENPMLLLRNDLGHPSKLPRPILRK